MEKKRKYRKTLKLNQKCNEYVVKQTTVYDTYFDFSLIFYFLLDQHSWGKTQAVLEVLS